LIPRLHLVTSDVVLQRPDFRELARTILFQLQDRVAIHLRGHSVSAADMYALAAELAPSVRNVPSLFINDRLDIALAAGIGAVQLTARSIPVAEARKIAPPGIILGYSAHSAEEAAAAAGDGADLILAGSIYQTPTHPDSRPAGLGLIEECVIRCNRPLIAIGGINAERVREVRQAGAYGVAVISAVWHAPDPVQAAHELAKMVES
jgi:thiazole tautomerase (transcriptional regulator TenI)